jgi:hypothetical protein
MSHTVDWKAVKEWKRWKRRGRKKGNTRNTLVSNVGFQ